MFSTLDNGNKNTQQVSWEQRLMKNAGKPKGALKPEYQEYYVHEMKAASEGRGWGPSAFCLPDGFFGALNPQEFVVTPKVVYTIGSNANDTNNIRWIYINAPHTAPEEGFHFAPIFSAISSSG